MPNARVVNAEPDSIKKICLFVDEKDIAYKKRNKSGYRASWPDHLSLREIIQREEKFFDKEQRYRIINNDINHTKIKIKNDRKIVPHIDGILQAEDSGELIYFIAIENEITEGHINEIEEGSRVWFEEDYQGVCEVILHKREKHKKIVGDIDIGNEQGVVVRFVKVTKVLESVGIRPTSVA